MSGRIAIVGGAGMQASAMIEALARSETVPMSGVAAIDRRWSDEARARVEGLGAKAWSYDIVSHRAEVTERLAEFDLVANLAGPFYALGTTALEIAIDAGVDYIDICDDSDATEAVLQLHGRAHGAGVRALTGMGSSPGMTNVLIRAALDALPDGATVRIAWTVDTADMTSAVLEHFFHCFQTALDARDRTPDWEALAPEVVDFPEPVSAQTVVTLGHPEPLTVGRFTRAERVENKGGIVPEGHLRFAWRLARLNDQLGATPDGASSLYDLFAALREESPTASGRIGSGLQIDVTVDGHGFRFASGAKTTMEDATGTPAAAGVLLMLDDPGLEPGTWAPECLVPRRVFEKLRLVSAGGGGLHMIRLENGEPSGQFRIRDLIAGGGGVR